MKKKPVVLICGIFVRDYRGTPAHLVRDTYIRALTEAADCTPLIAPATGKDFDVAALDGIYDGLLFTGDSSHLSPECYGAAREFEDEYLSPQRDGMSLPLLQSAIARDIPTLAVCRGFQELNVVRGGTLHQYVHKQPGKRDHRADPARALADTLRATAHSVAAQKGGLFEQWGLPETFGVNSLHTQGVDRTGAGLHVEALSDDGLVEAVSLPGHRFMLGVQWHPEGDFGIHGPDGRMFAEFGKAVRK